MSTLQKGPASCLFWLNGSARGAAATGLLHPSWPRLLAMLLLESHSSQPEIHPSQPTTTLASASAVAIQATVVEYRYYYSTVAYLCPICCSDAFQVSSHHSKNTPSPSY